MLGGFTLMELVVGVLLLGILALVFVSIFVTGSSSTKRTTEKDQALFHAKQTLDELKNCVSADPSTLPTLPIECQNLYTRGTYCLNDASNPLDGKFTRCYEVTPVVINGQTLYKVTVTMDWQPASPNP
ncbi:MAG: prepilin-type N-terminal cleavage/methylation domain-containing protein [Elusimicrobia bacterium]|nr:prepilin-type N-terminal cleavage/methylation domain-containing protein [Elusimicrobiota bacterium]